MTLNYYIVAALAFLLPFGTSFLIRKKGEKILFRFKMIFSVILTALFVFRYLDEGVAISKTIGLNQHSPFGPDGSLLALLSTVVLWLTYASGLLMVTYPGFFKSVKPLTNVVKYFAFPTYIIAVATIPIVIKAMDGEMLASTFYWRDVVYAAEVGFGLGYTWTVFFIEKRDPGLRMIPKATVTFLAMLAVTMPEFTLQVLFGYAPAYITVKDFSISHRILLYGAFLLPVILHFCLRKFSYEQKRFMLLYFALGTMISYCSKYTFASFFDPRSWPLHLCNTAMFIVPLCLTFKWEKLYYFTFFINVLGALFAMLMPNYSDSLNLLSTGCVEFWLNHYCAFFMPILMMSLRIFKRPKFKEFIYSIITFSVYFFAMVFINAWLKDTDFFFVNSDFVADKLGKWAEDLRKVTGDDPNGQKWKVLTVSIKQKVLTFYPLYQILFYLVYIVLAFATWFVYEQFFEITDLYTEMTERRKKIKIDRLALKAALGGRSIKEPVNMDGTNQLILKNFSKRYSTSDVFAVKDANLSVEGGQIFGFLGPNGAGKSTIIKSIVGIQTITSGAIEVCGYDVEKQSVESKMQIGFVPDHYALYENLTGREYINYIADLYGVSVEDRTKRMDEYVERFHLTGAFDNQMKTYSHGMKQKITIMSALVHDPKLWILDEPLTGLDPESIFQVKECMKAHAAKGNIVFFSSHIIDVVERICDKIAIIKKGNILCTKTVKEIEESGTSLEEFYMATIGEKNG